MPRKPDLNKKNRYFDPFPERLRKLMEEHGTSQEEIKSVLELKNRQSVTGYVDGSTVPTAEKIIAIAEYYNVSADYLLGLTDSPTVDKDMKIALSVTGLSQKAVENIQKLSTDTLSTLLERDDFLSLLNDIDSLENRVQDCKKELIEIQNAETTGYRYWAGRPSLDDLERITPEEWIAQALFEMFKSDYSTMRLSFKDVGDAFSIITEEITGISGVILDGKELLKRGENMKWQA